MNELFADSFVFFALLNPKDQRHAQAVHVMAASRQPLVTTAWILTELADGLCGSRTRGVFIALERRLRTDSRVAIVPPEQQLFERGVQLYRTRPDKDWSLTDCISFVVMTDCGITDALTGDHHYQRAGFVPLLK